LVVPYVREIIVWQIVLHTRVFGSPDGKIIVWHNRIWFRISTDKYGYAKQVLNSDLVTRGFVIHMPNKFQDGSEPR